VKDLVGIPWRLAFALQRDDWFLRQDIIWAKGNPMPESVKDRCTKSHEYIFLLTKSPKYYYDYKAIAEKSIHFETDKRAKLGRVPHKSGKSASKDNQYAIDGVGFSEDGLKNKRSVWNINTKPSSVAHFAVFPEKIPELCIKAGSRVGDTVLDPFFGSGTTGFVAQRLDRKWVGIELNPEYIKIAEQRFRQQELFAPHGSEMEEHDYITHHDTGDENDKRNNKRSYPMG
jgi:DNA modification methylase